MADGHILVILIVAKILAFVLILITLCLNFQLIMLLEIVKRVKYPRRSTP